MKINTKNTHFLTLVLTLILLVSWEIHVSLTTLYEINFQCAILTLISINKKVNVRVFTTLLMLERVSQTILTILVHN